MDIDKISLILEAKVDKMKAALKDTMNVLSKINDTTSGVSNSFNKMANNVDNAMAKMSKSIDSSGAKQKLQDLRKQLNFQIDAYNKNLATYKEWGALATTKRPESIIGMGGSEVTKAFGEPITRESLMEQKERINSLRSEIQTLEDTIKNVPELKLVPKTNEGKNELEDIGNKAKETSRKFNELSSKTKSISSAFSKIGSSIKTFKKGFSGIGSAISKATDKNIRTLKKLTLGLIGVRTAMSLLTRGVNAYLSFDSELQDSISNSWNMLGSLLAPAIELVANAFAIATNYIAQFVNALTGIDLVARANAKALDTQAKANEKANAAQRGLLSMDEITNLPTESAGGGSPLKQITTRDVKNIKLIDDFLMHLKSKEWHLAGEDIAHAINRGLKAIDWDNVKPKAQELGKNIASFLNGVFELNWYDLGRNLGEGLNTAIDFAYGFVKEFSFIQLFGGIAKTINKSIETIDWQKAAETLSLSVVKMMNGIIAFLDQVDWENIGSKVVEFLSDIDWLTISLTNTKLQLALLKAAVGLAKGVIKQIPNYISKEFETVMKALGTEGGKAFANALIWGINRLINSVNLMINPLQAIINSIASISGKTAPTIGGMRFIPYLETGTNYIEEEGIYHLHEGEEVVPKRYNPSADGYDSRADNKAIISLLIDLNSNIQSVAERPTVINMDSRRVAEAIYDDTQTITNNRNMSNVVMRS